MRRLLRVYYGIKCWGRKTPEFQYCDEPDIPNLPVVLHTASMHLHLRPHRLESALHIRAEDGGGTLADFTLKEPIDLGKEREKAFDDWFELQADEAVDQRTPIYLNA